MRGPFVGLRTHRIRLLTGPDSMQRPPFPMVRTSVLGGAKALELSGCCPPSLRPNAGGRQRAVLADLDARFHCSIIGTCLSTGELRRTVQRMVPLDKGADDIDVHHEAVSLAHRGGAAAKAIHKALEQRHGTVVRQFASATDATAVLAMWNAALASGDVAGAYWATMTHPDVSIEVRQKAFGDVHMLSHLVGAANRADIRRLVALEAENDALKEQLARQQQRMQSLSTEYEVTLRHANDEISVLRGRQQVSHHAVPADGTAQRDLIATQAQRIATMEARHTQANAVLEAVRAEVDTLRDKLAASHAELDTLEALVSRQQQMSTCQISDLPALANKQIVYVGGRPGIIPVIRAVVERAGGRFQNHDGGLEDRKQLLPAMVAAADVVVFPVDCVDHDSVSTLKRVCQHQGVDYFPIRSASLASFVELIDKLSLRSA